MSEIKSREYGDHMAQENTKYLHVPHIVMCTYFMLLAYSLLASFITGEAWFTQVLFYLAVMVLFSSWHLLAHERWTGTMHEVHKRHHHVTFPPDNFYGEPGINKRLFGRETPTFFQLIFGSRPQTAFSWKERISHDGPLFIFLFLALAIEKIVFKCFTGTVLFSLIMALVIAKIGAALHESFHIKGFELERYQWYLELRTYHYIHHLGTTKHNYAILNIGLIDGVMNTVMAHDPAVKKDTTFHPTVRLRVNPDSGKAPTCRDFLSVCNPSTDNSGTTDSIEVILPPNIDADVFQNIKENFGSLTLRLLFSEDHGRNIPLLEKQENQRRIPTVTMRIGLVTMSIWFWFKGAHTLMSYTSTVKLISGIDVHDVGHHLTAAVFEVLSSQDFLRISYCNLQMLISDVLALLLFALTIFGPTVRPAVTGFAAFTLRALLQFMTPVVAEPAQKLNLSRTLPSLFGDNTNVKVLEHSPSFVCPHIIVAVVFFIECYSVVTHKEKKSGDDKTFDNLMLQPSKGLGRANRLLSSLRPIALLVLAVQILAALSLRINFSFDILVAVGITWLCSLATNKLPPYLDYIRSL